jgi:two-component system cell cycle response regulator
MSEAIPQQRVLIVDDSKFVRTTISRIIKPSFDVREEADGEAGWEAIASDASIVMVFSDLGMPRLDGFGLIERIRKSDTPRIRNLPVIVISGNEDEETKRRAKDAGANDFITKTTDGTEILTRIDNLLRLVDANRELKTSREVIEQTVTHDPLTGAFTPHYLMTEGAKHFSHARRHGGPLSVLCFRVDSYNEIAQKVGKNVADQLLARIVKLVMGSLRAEDSMGRTADTTFTVISAGNTPQQALAFARRLHEQLEKAQVNYRNQLLQIRASIGVAALGVDSAASIGELMQMAMQRLDQAASRKAEPIVVKDDITLVKPPSLPSDIERAVQTLESADAERLGESTSEILRRLLPLIAAACKRLNVDLPVEKIAELIKVKPK